MNDESRRLPGHERSVQEIASEMGDLANELYTRIDINRELQEHPYRTLAIAAAVGYFLGGGLFTRMTAGMLRVGVRAMAIPAFQTAMSQAMESRQGGSPY